MLWWLAAVDLALSFGTEDDPVEAGHAASLVGEYADEALERLEESGVEASGALELARCSRFTLGFGKQAFYKQVDLDEVSAYNTAVNAIAMNCLDADAQEGMKAFLEKRDAIWVKR